MGPPAAAAAVSGSRAAVVPAPALRWLGRLEYQPTWTAMREFTDRRHGHSRDEIWFLEHPPVYTQGMSGRAEHLLAPGDIPVVSIDRGGQVTYHGPGQLVVYPLIDLRRLGLGVRGLVVALERAIVRLAAAHGIAAAGRRDAPGVYVAERKLASLGLRIRRGCSYHGLAVNVDVDLEPFSRINPCGYAGLQMTRLADLGVRAGVDEIARLFAPLVVEELGLPAASAWC